MDDYYVFPQLNVVNNYTVVGLGFLYKNSNYPYSFYHATNSGSNIIGMVARIDNQYHEYVFSMSADTTYYWNRNSGSSAPEDYRTVNSDFNLIDSGLYYHETIPATQSGVTYTVNVLSSFADCVQIAKEYFHIGGGFPISYRPTNCYFPNAPTEAAVGDTVIVSVVFDEGYGIVNPSDIYVTCNGVTVPSTYNNGTLTFTMPDPSQ